LAAWTAACFALCSGTFPHLSDLATFDERDDWKSKMRTAELEAFLT